MKKCIVAGLLTLVLVHPGVLLAVAPDPAISQRKVAEAEKLATEAAAALAKSTNDQPIPPKSGRPADEFSRQVADEKASAAKARAEADEKLKDPSRDLNKARASATPDRQAKIDKLTQELDQIKIDLARAQEAEASLDGGKLRSVRSQRAKVAGIERDREMKNRIYTPLFDKKSAGKPLNASEEELYAKLAAEIGAADTELAAEKQILVTLEKVLYPGAIKSLVEKIPGLLKESSAKGAEKARLDQERIEQEKLEKEVKDLIARADAARVRDENATEALEKLKTRIAEWNNYVGEFRLWSPDHQRKMAAKDKADFDLAAAKKAAANALTLATTEKKEATLQANNVLLSTDQWVEKVKLLIVKELDREAKTEATREKARLQALLDRLEGKDSPSVREHVKQVVEEWNKYTTAANHARNAAFLKRLYEARDQAVIRLTTARNTLRACDFTCFTDVKPLIEKLDARIAFLNGLGSGASAGGIDLPRVEQLDFGSLRLPAGKPLPPAKLELVGIVDREIGLKGTNVVPDRTVDWKICAGWRNLRMGSIIRIDDEEMEIAGYTGGPLTPVDRGVNGTKVAPHAKGAKIYLVKAKQ